MGLIACGSDNDSRLVDPTPQPNPEPNTIVDVAVENGNFTTLVAALDATGLDDTLDDPTRDFTVFAPTDDAFALLGEEAIAALLDDPDTLSDILLYHVIADAEVDSTAAVDAAGTTVEMANGDSVGLSLWDDDLLVNLSLVTTVDVQADNGVIHVIDTVIVGDAELPAPRQSIVDVAIENGSFTTLVQLLVDSGLDETLDDLATDFTVFAPTDAAFGELSQETLDALAANPALLQDVLEYHVIAGSEINATAAIAAAPGTIEMANGENAALSYVDETLRVNTSAVTQADVMAENGVIHVVDKVLMPPTPVDTEQTIAGAASGDDRFSTLVGLLSDAGLVGALSDDSATYTVFAPTNAAFEAVSQETMDALAANPALLEEVLLTHVVEDVAADSITAYTLNGTDLTTLSGNMIGVDIVNSALQVGGATVIQADLNATNGVIHVIDSVIIPDMP